MIAEHWIIVGVILINLLAPLLAKLVHFHTSRPQTDKRQRKPDRPDGPRALPMAWMGLPFMLALSLDIYVILYQTGQAGPMLRSDLWISDLALFMAGLQVLAMAALAGVNVFRFRDRGEAAALTELRHQHAAIQETLRASLVITTGLAKLSDQQAAIQGRLAATERALLKTFTKVRDEQAAQGRLAGTETALLKIFTKACDEQAAIYQRIRVGEKTVVSALTKMLDEQAAIHQRIRVGEKTVVSELTKMLDERNNKVEIRSDFLSARSSWLSGLARTLDVAALYDDYNMGLTPVQSDWSAFICDMEAVGSDFSVVLDEYANGPQFASAIAQKHFKVRSKKEGGSETAPEEQLMAVR